MARLEAPWELMGSSPERGRRRGRTRGAVGHCRGGARPGLCGLLFVSCSLPALPLVCVLWLAVREGEEKEEETRGKRKRRKRKEKRKKEKIWKKI
jgi:hypothetical protein